MSHSKNKIDWCLRKAEKEIDKGEKHRGLVKVKPDKLLANAHITKAEHYLSATSYLKKGNYSDISASTAFYAMYHCLLAITAKFGYESRNQECTFALIESLIEDEKISFDKGILDKIAAFNEKQDLETTSIEIREQYQYGTSLAIEDDIYKKILSLAQQVISKTKLIIEE